MSTEEMNTNKDQINTDFQSKVDEIVQEVKITNIRSVALKLKPLFREFGLDVEGQTPQEASWDFARQLQSEYGKGGFDRDILRERLIDFHGQQGKTMDEMQSETLQKPKDNKFDNPEPKQAPKSNTQKSVTDFGGDAQSIKDDGELSKNQKILKLYFEQNIEKMADIRDFLEMRHENGEPVFVQRVKNPIKNLKKRIQKRFFEQEYSKEDIRQEIFENKFVHLKTEQIEEIIGRTAS